jgi:predicted peptidase
MKVWIVLLSLLISLTGVAQSTPDNGSNITKRKVFQTSSSGNGTWDRYRNAVDLSLDNFKFALLQYQPRDSGTSLNPKKQPAIIFLHGIGERGGRSDSLPTYPVIDGRTYWDTTPGSSNTSVDDVYILPPMRNLRRIDNSNTAGSTCGALDDLVGRKFWNANKKDSSEFWFFAPQLWGDDGDRNSDGVDNVSGDNDYSDFGFDKWPMAIVRTIINKIKTDPYYLARIDTTQIYLTGLSLGGGGTLSGIADSVVNHQIAAAVPVCPGYNTSPADNNTGTNKTITTLEHQMIARSGLPIWIQMALNDGADNGGGVDEADDFVSNLMAQNPVFPPKYTRYQDGGHSIWNRCFPPYTYNSTTCAQSSMWAIGRTTTSNGTMYFQPTGGVNWKNVYEWMLQFSTNDR